MRVDSRKNLTPGNSLPQLKIQHESSRILDTVGEPCVPAWQNDKFALSLSLVEEFANGIEFWG
jgi:hypothetical protein